MRLVTRQPLLRRAALALFLAGSAGLGVALGVSSGHEAGSDSLPPSLATLDAAALAGAHAATSQEPTYIGGRSGCRRCHLRQFRSWQRTPHADALETLPEESREDPECVRCHTTGYGQPSGFTSVADTPELVGIGCEACHGPGSNYSDEDIMKDRDASLAAGLRIPDEQTCLGCHNSESPTFSGTFDFEAAKAAGVHEIGG